MKVNTYLVQHTQIDACQFVVDRSRILIVADGNTSVDNTGPKQEDGGYHKEIVGGDQDNS